MKLIIILINLILIFGIVNSQLTQGSSFETKCDQSCVAPPDFIETICSTYGCVQGECNVIYTCPVVRGCEPGVCVHPILVSNNIHCKYYNCNCTFLPSPAEQSLNECYDFTCANDTGVTATPKCGVPSTPSPSPTPTPPRPPTSKASSFSSSSGSSTDASLCLIGKCNSTSMKCLVIPSCNDNNPCTIDSCDESNGDCSYKLDDCSIQNNQSTNPCIQYTCDSGFGCVAKNIVPIPSTCKRGTFKLSSGVIAGIVIGSGAAVAIAVFVGRKLYKMKATRAKEYAANSSIGMASANPFYNKKPSTDNPLFDGGNI